VQSGPLAFANIATPLNGTKSITNADTTDTVELAVAAGHITETWPSLNNWQAGVYKLGYYATDMCGRQSSPAAYATLDYRCNNPPVVSAITSQYTSQTFASVQQGTEILLNAAAAYDLDAHDSLAFYWCLISHPSSSAGTITTAYESVGSYLRVPTITGGYAEGFALLKPDYPGTYVITATVSDGCNFVPVTFTVTVNAVNCCSHSAKATGANTIMWASNTTMSYSSPLSADASTIQSCLPGDYVLSTGEGGLAGTQPVYKSLYSPVYIDANTNIVTLSALPWASGSVYGCTWPGAANFNPLATIDNGGCYCLPNNNTWDVLTGTNAYMRKADQTGPVASVLKTPGQLQFYSSLGSVAPVTSPVCGPTTINTATTVASGSTDIRIDTSKAVANTSSTVGVLLSRPSTSWDATVYYSVTSKTMVTYTTSNTTNQYTFPGQLYCTVSVPQGLYNDTSVTVAYPTNSSLAQCLGYYTLTLSSTANNICPSAVDLIDVAVVCPYPPYVNVLVETDTLLWDGTKFVQNTTNPAQWFTIDARDTPYSASLNYTLAITSAPPAHSYYGIAADLNAPSGPQTVLVSYYNGTTPVLAGSFLPLRGKGAYTVTLFANDGCNPASSDSVTINTQCLSINNLAYASNAAVSSSTASATNYQLNYQNYIIANGSYNAGTNFMFQPNSSALNQNLTYAIKVLQRPPLTYGDMGYYADPFSSQMPYQCMRGANFYLSGYSGNGQNIFTVLQNITTNLQLVGNYQFEVAILDGCDTVAQTFSLAIPAGSCSQPPYTVASNYTTSVWANGSYTPVQIGLTGNFLLTGISVGWFLTIGPAGYAYPSTPVPVNSGMTCGAYSNPLTVNGYTTRTGDLWSPVFTQSNSGNGTFWYVPPSVPPMDSQQMTAQVIGCQVTTVGAVSFKTQCNTQATFICLDGSTSCGTGNMPYNNINGFGVGNSQAESVWDKTNGHFTPLFFSALAHPGPGDWNSYGDVITYQFLIKSAPSGSWWNIAYLAQTLTFTFLVADGAPGIFDDNNGFVAINSAIGSNLQTPVQNAINTSDATRVYVANTTFRATVGVYATIPSSLTLGYTVAPVCYTPGLGRTFTATVTFAVLPPAYFRSYSSQAVSAATNKHTVPAGADVTPYTLFLSNFNAEATSLANGIATAAGYTLSTTTTPAFSNQATAPNNFLLMTTSGAAGNAHAGYQVTTSIVPDLPGTYTLDVGVADNCPGAGFNYLSSDNSLNVATSAVAVGVDCSTLNSVSLVANSTGYNLWSNSTTKFGTWTYNVSAPNFASITTFAGNNSFNCFGTATTCVNTTTFTAPGTLTFPATTTNQTTLGVLTFTGVPNGITGASFRLAVTTAGTFTQGAELYVGCQASPSGGYFSPSALGTVTYFARYDTATAAPPASVMVLPDACTSPAYPSVDVVFVQFPTISGSAPGFTVAVTNAYVMPSSYNYVPGDASVYVSLTGTGSSATVPLASTSVAANTLASILTLSTTGYPAMNLPGNSYSYTPTVTVSLASQPPSWAFANSCPSGISGSATTTAVGLQCPATSPSLGAVGSTNIAFNTNSFHYNSATVQVSGVGPTVLYSDVSFSFNVTAAPDGSILSPLTLASYVLPKLLANPLFTGYNNVTKQPIWSAVINNCTSINETVLNRYWANGQLWYTTNSTLSGTTASSYALYIDPASIGISLAPWVSSPSAVTWLGNSFDDTNYPQFALLQAGSASFVPDIAGTYSVTGMYNDQCNPVKSLSAVSFTVASCPTGSATVSTINNGSITISPTQSGRVLLQGTITGLASYESVSWTVTPPTGTAVPVLSDANSLYPSFLATVTGTYTVTLTVNTGCPNSPIVGSTTVNVGCGYPTLSPSTAVAQATSSSPPTYRLGQTGTLTLAYVPGLGLNTDKILLVGEPGCPVNNSWFAPPSTVTYTCPSATYSVAVQSVFPSTILTVAPNQLLQVTVKVNGQAVIPPGLMDQLFSDVFDSNAIVINIVFNGASVQCTSPYVSNAALGQIVCRVPSFPAAYTTTASLQTYSGVVTVSLLNVNSNDINANAAVTVSNAPVVTSAVAVNTYLSPLGQSIVNLQGFNLAFDPVSAMYFSPADTTVTIAGSPCTAVGTTGTATLFSSQLSITCAIPAGYGQNVPVTVQVGFRKPQAPTAPWYSAVSAPAFVFNYDAPLVTSISPVTAGQTANSLGGYWFQANIKNLGLAYFNSASAPPVTSSGQLTPPPYADLRFQLGNIPITSFTVSAGETSGSPATVQFLVPRGCGAGLDLRVFRVNTMSAVPVPASVPTFSYANPVITCVGQPYVDSTSQGCTRVFIEGTNFGSPANATLVNVTFWGSGNAYHGSCDDVEYQSASDYVRVSCRVPTTAQPGDFVSLTNECGQSSGSSATALPSSIELSGCGNAYQVLTGQKFTYGINAPLAPATQVVAGTVQQVVFTQGGPWKSQMMSNGLFIGLILPPILLVLIVYPLYVFVSRRR